MIRVLRIVNRFNLGGPTYNVTFLTAFLPDEFETMLCGGKHELHEGDSSFIAKQYGVEPVIIESLQRSINLFQDRKALKEIRAIIRAYKPHIVHTHASKAGAVGRAAAFKEGVPVVVHTFHGHVFHSYFGALKTWLYKLAERRLAKKTDAIIAISERQKYELSELHKIAPPDKFRIIPLGFDLIKFHQNKDEKRRRFRSDYLLEEDEIAIGIIGRLAPIKNHELFFESLKLVHQKTSKKIRAFVVGDGERRDELEELARIAEQEIGVGKIVFTSWIKQVHEVLSGFDLICLTSYNEGTPVSLIEAQAAGVPVVTTDVGGVRDVVWDGETGFVVSDFEPVSMAEKMLFVIENQEIRLKMSQNGWNFVEHKFSYTRLCHDVAKLYHELLEKKKVL